MACREDFEAFELEDCPKCGSAATYAMRRCPNEDGYQLSIHACAHLISVFLRRAAEVELVG